MVIGPIYRYVLQAEWPWLDTAGGRSTAEFTENVVIPDILGLDLGATWRVAEEAGDVVAAAAWMFALRVSIVAWRLAA